MRNDSISKMQASNDSSTWSEMPLESVALINPESLGRNTPTTLEFRYIDISSVSAGVIDWGNVTTQNIVTAPSRARRIIRPGDVLFCAVRPGLQAHAFADWLAQAGYICSTGFAVIRAKEGHAPRYLFHLVFSDFVNQQVKRYETGSNYPAISETDIRSLVVPVPVFDEQHRIAEILDSIDAVIQLSEALIAKLKQMKAGLLHRLLTRGIDKNGRLRDPIRHPEQFEQSSLGLIPKEWETTTLDEIGDWLSGGTPSKSRGHYWNGTIPWVSPKDMKQFYIGDSIDKITEEGANNGSLKVPANTVLIVVRGMILAHTLPICVTTRELAFNQDVKAIICNDEVSPMYLAFWLVANSSRLLSIVTESTHGTKRFDMNDLLKIKLAFPKDQQEQEKIVQIVSACENRINSEAIQHEKLAQLKRGLMRDLLTGRVRVNEQRLEAIAG